MRNKVIEFCNKRSKKETEDSMKTSRKTSFVPGIKKVVENKKLKTTEFKVPKDMKQAKDVCQKICDAYRIGITFDDKYGNFGSDWNQCACHSAIECSKFNDWNYDLLPFAVLHELGHMKDTSTDANANTFVKEFAAWKWAIDRYILIFKQNIGIKQARYMMKCLSSYLPDYNTFSYDTSDKYWFEEKEGRFWCPIKKHVML